MGEPISAFEGLGSSTYPYSLLWQVPEPGVYSFHAVAMDNSKNGVMSGISTITATSGQGALPQVSFKLPIQLAEGSAETTDGQITSIDLVTGGYGYTSAPEVEILGGNGDARATAYIESDQSSPTYGQVTSIVVDESGSGYDESATVQLIGGFSKVQPSGTGAQARVVWNFSRGVYEIEVMDGGEGYTSPPEVTIYGSGAGMQAVAFVEDGKVVSVEITDQGQTFLNEGSQVVFEGGLPFSEVSITVDADDPDGVVDRVILFENGKQIGSDTLAPFNFIWEAGPMGYYDLVAEAIDNQGNKNVSKILRRDVFYSDPPVIELQPITPASFTPVIDEGSGAITSVEIQFPGLGYHSPPQLKFEDPEGTGAEYLANLDDEGRVTSVTQLSEGSGYSPSTKIVALGGLDTVLENAQQDFGKTMTIGVYTKDDDTLIDPNSFMVFINGEHRSEITVSGIEPNYAFIWKPEALGLYSIRVRVSSVDGMSSNSKTFKWKLLIVTPMRSKFLDLIPTKFPIFQLLPSLLK